MIYKPILICFFYLTRVECSMLIRVYPCIVCAYLELYQHYFSTSCFLYLHVDDRDVYTNLIACCLLNSHYPNHLFYSIYIYSVLPLRVNKEDYFIIMVKTLSSKIIYYSVKVRIDNHLSGIAKSSLYWVNFKHTLNSDWK